MDGSWTEEGEGGGRRKEEGTRPSSSSVSGSGKLLNYEYELTKSAMGGL